MKKAASVLMCFCLLLAGIILSGCSVKQKQPTINYQRRLQNYLPSNSSRSKPVASTIDLSEGPKTQYDSKLGPNDLNFDITIKNPY